MLRKGLERPDSARRLRRAISRVGLSAKLCEPVGRLPNNINEQTVERAHLSLVVTENVSRPIKNIPLRVKVAYLSYSS